MSRDVVAVRIAGHEYKIKTGTDADQVRELAGYVDRAMTRVRDRTGTVDTLDVSVLTCLYLAREILTLRAERLPDDAVVIEDHRLRDLIERVEQAAGLQEGAGSANASEASSRPDGTAQDDGDGEARGARTLELPTLDSLRDREAASPEPEAGVEPRRAAAGGRDRVS